ncbi:MAG TPA: prepilin-type N-terminal cleavage/methylation domain-containing protein [Chthoniobacterales bacterium]
MTKKSPSAFTLVEMLVVIAIIATIAAFALPAITGALTRGQLAQAVSNARQVHLATFAMTTDGTQTGDPKFAWPGDLFNAAAPAKITTVADFVTRLVDNDYLKAGDLKVFAAPGITPWVGTYTAPPDANSTGNFAPAFNGNTNCAFKIYKVTDRDPGNTIFLATKNFTYTDAVAISTTTTPFGDKGFVIFHKGGDGTFYKKQQATNKNLLGNPPGGGDVSPPPNETNDSFLQAQ